MYSDKPQKKALQVPVETHIRGRLYTLEVPELTPPGCRPTTVQAATKAEAQRLAEQAIEHASRVGLPVYNTPLGKAAKQRWSSIGETS